MTMPNERTRAVLAVRSFLHQIASPYNGGYKGIKREVREAARRLLRHYPLDCEIAVVSRAVPELFAPPKIPPSKN